MKIIVDKLPKTKEECLFCIEGNGGCHRCLFHMDAWDYHEITTNYYDCKLTKNEACPYLEEVGNGL